MHRNSFVSKNYEKLYVVSVCASFPATYGWKSIAIILKPQPVVVHIGSIRNWLVINPIEIGNKEYDMC